MEKNTVSNGSKLIAEFRGYEYIPYSKDLGYKAGWWKKDYAEVSRKHGLMPKFNSNKYLCRRHHELRYYNSWDWLMPVVEKIFTLKQESAYGDVYNWNPFNQSFGLYGGFEFVSIHKKAVFLGVVQFIEWYNKQKQ